MDESKNLRAKVLGLFSVWGRETLDLHELFEAGDSNDPELRREVFDTIERLVEEGLLEERGNDFYALTKEGQRLADAHDQAAQKQKGTSNTI